jgi:hypothetical protein
MKDLFSKIVQWTVKQFKSLLNLYRPGNIREKGMIWSASLALGTFIVVVLVLSYFWGHEPERFDVRANTDLYITQAGDAVTGTHTTAALIRVIDTLLDKPGGLLGNDLLPPGLLMDNIPNWEYGALIQARDMARSLRNDMSRSQSQSLENEFLARAEPHLNFSNTSWIFPSSESEYRKSVKELKKYLAALTRQDDPNTQFYARADNLRDWLAVVEKRLGSLSQQLSASVEQERINTDLAGDAAASQSTKATKVITVRTSWSKIDDVFYQARGASWALIHLLHAIELDFADVLKKKNALISLQQIIRELEASQQSTTSPVILNGRGFGIFANYSLVMASYISRANAATIDLRNLLAQG